MPFSAVGAVAGVVGAGASVYGASKAGNSGASPSAAGWETNAMALTDMMGTSSADQFDPYNLYSSQWANQYGQAQQIQQQAATNAQQFNAQQAAATQQQQGLSSQIQGASNAYLNSGNQAQFQTAMNQLQPAYYGAGGAAMQMGSQLQGQMGQAQAYGNQVMQTAFDPQQTLYNQQFQLEQQQADANQAMRGLATSGVGAELSNQADLNFNTNWQNQQLTRQTQGLAAYDTNNQSIAGLAQGANQSYTTGLQDMTTGAAIPYNTAQTIYNNNQAAYGNQQAALSADQAAYLQQMNTAQQGWANQAQALTGSQTALANQQNNLNAGNAWYNQQEANLLGYYNGSVPTWQNGSAAATANGYAGIGNYLGGMTGTGTTGASPLATGVANMTSDPIGTLNSIYGWTSPYQNAGAYGGQLASTTPYDGTDASTMSSYMGSVE
jgi:hypothetical protein